MINIFKKSALKSRKNKFVFIVIILAVMFLVWPFQKVSIGEQGVLYSSINGKITSENMSPGWHLVLPFIQKLTEYPINEKHYQIARDNKSWNNGIDASIIAPTKDNQKVSMDVTFLYMLEKAKLEQIYNRFDGQSIDDIETKYLQSIFKNAVIDVASQYTAYDIYSTKRNEAQNKIAENLRDSLNEKGIVLKSVLIDTVRLSEEMESVLKSKAIAEAAVIEAQGKSDANKLINDSLSDKIMTYEALSKLSDSLKLVVVPSGTDSKIDFSTILEQILNQQTGANQQTSTNK